MASNLYIVNDRIREYPDGEGLDHLVASRAALDALTAGHVKEPGQ
jgi:hypothetical protein